MPRPLGLRIFAEYADGVGDGFLKRELDRQNVLLRPAFLLQQWAWWPSLPTVGSPDRDFPIPSTLAILSFPPTSSEYPATSAG